MSEGALRRNTTTGGLKRSATTGGVKRATSSSGTGCCCCACASATNCASCNAGTTPTAFTVTVAGIDYSTWSGVCIGCGTDGLLAVPPNPNTTIVVAQGGSCNWSAHTGTGTISAYTGNPSCGGPASGSATPNVFYDLSRVSGGWGFSVSFLATVAGKRRIVYLFRCDIPTLAVVDCCQGLNFGTNANVGGTCLDEPGIPQQTIYVGTGGYAVATPCT